MTRHTVDGLAARNEKVVLNPSRTFICRGYHAAPVRKDCDAVSRRAVPHAAVIGAASTGLLGEDELKRYTCFAGKGTAVIAFVEIERWVDPLTYVAPRFSLSRHMYEHPATAAVDPLGAVTSKPSQQETEALQFSTYVDAISLGLCKSGQMGV